MANDVELSPLLEDLIEHSKEKEPAADELRLALNALISKYELHPSVVISLLARFSAGYIYLTQKLYNQYNADVVVEENFQNMLVAHLTDLDMRDVRVEMDKIVREIQN